MRARAVVGLLALLSVAASVPLLACSVILPFDDYEGDGGAGSLPHSTKGGGSGTSLGSASPAASDDPTATATTTSPTTSTTATTTSAVDAGDYPDVSDYVGCHDCVDGGLFCGSIFNDEGGYPGPKTDLVQCIQGKVAHVTHCASCTVVAGDNDKCP